MQNRTGTSSPASSARPATLRGAAISSSLSAQEKRLATLEATVKSEEAKLSKITPQVAAIEGCLPEVQSEFNGLEIEGTISSPYISNKTKTSLACEKLLYRGVR